MRLDKLVKVIETNITYGKDGLQSDFQSRIIEVGSWDEYIIEIKERNPVFRYSCIGNMMGESFPRFVREFYIDDFTYDNFHLSYSFKNGLGNKMKKLAYLINE